MKYKVGDKVKIINESLLPNKWNGRIGTIIKIHPRHTDVVYLDIAYSNYPFETHEIELYKSKKQKIKLP